LEVEEPGACGACASFHCHPTVAGMLGATLRRDEVVQVGEPGEKRLLAATWVMEPLHREQLPLDGVMRLLSERAGHRPLGGCKDRIPARFLVAQPAPYTCPVGGSRRGGDVRDTVAEPLTERQHPQAPALACPGHQGVALGAQGRADRGGDGHQLAGQVVDRVAPAGAPARPWQQRPPTFARAVEAIGEAPPEPVRRLVLGCRTLALAIGLGKGPGRRVCRVPQGPEPPATNHRGELHLLGATAAVLLVGPDRDRQRQPTPGQHGHQSVVAQRTDEAVERHGRERVEHGAPLQTAPAMRGQSDSAGDVGAQRAIAQGERRQDGEDGFTPRTRAAPDGEAAQPDAHIGRVTGQASTAVTRGLVGELQAQGEEKGQHAFDKGLAISQELKGGRLVLTINGDGAVVPCPFARLSQVSPLW
jgi:hypothetical protein